MSTSDNDKLRKLSELEGVPIDDILEAGTFDSVCMGICMNPMCEYTTDVEPDCEHAHCEECGTQSVKSALCLAGII